MVEWAKGVSNGPRFRKDSWGERGGRGQRWYCLKAWLRVFKAISELSLKMGCQIPITKKNTITPRLEKCENLAWMIPFGLSKPTRVIYLKWAKTCFLYNRETKSDTNILSGKTKLATYEQGWNLCRYTWSSVVLASNAGALNWCTISFAQLLTLIVC